MVGKRSTNPKVSSIKSPAQESETRFQIMADCAPVLLWMADTDGLCTFFNQTWLDFTGRTLEQEWGVGWAEGVHFEEFQNCMDTYVEHFNRRQPFEMEYRLKRADGELRWILDRGAPFFNSQGDFAGYIGSCVDVTERKLLVDMLQKTQGELEVRVRERTSELEIRNRQLLEAQALSRLGFWEWNLEKDEFLWTDEHYRIFGMGPQEKQVNYALYLELIHPEDRQRVDQEIKDSVATGRPYFITHRVLSADGNIRFVQGRGEVTQWEKGKAVQMVGTSHDVTELVAAREAAMQASELKSQFLASMSHEIRTPINGVIGMTSLLGDTQLDGEQKKFVEAIRWSAESLLAVINDILDFSKVESGKLDLEDIDFDVGHLVQDIYMTMSFAAETRGIRLDLGRAELTNRYVSDAGRIRQVLTNLLSNAIKFTEKGGVSLRFQIEEDFPDRTRMRFEIIDTGIGMSEATVKKLFQPFSQADASTSRRYGGSGLGLSICQKLVHLMGGQIGVKSELGRGSHFWVQLDLKKGIPVSEFKDQKVQVALPIQKRDVKVLVVEDNAINREVAMKHLVKLGFQAEAVDSGFKAMERLKEAQFDVVIMDCQMPDLDGYETTQMIRKSQGSFSQIPIIAMTASAIKGEREKCLMSGMNEYISKPFRKEELLRIIDQFTQDKKAA